MERMVVRIGEIDPDGRNPYKHSESKVAARMESLGLYGQVREIIVRRVKSRYVVIAGHCTFEAAKRMGWDEIECLVVEWDEAKSYGWMLIDNQRGEQDTALTVSLLDELEESGVSLSLFDMDENELAMMRDLVGIDEWEVEKQGGGKKRGGSGGEKAKRSVVKVVLVMEQLDVLEQAIKKSGVKNRGDAVERICRAFLEGDAASSGAVMDEFFIEGLEED